MDDIKSKVDSDGKIKKNEFVEFFLNAQLLREHKQESQKEESKPRINKEKEVKEK